ncbi:MAG: 30S ribosomal protein S7 [Chloroflexi bacterium]|nr:30S ribosomal protein S7 [Chloroflexota bacterium]
MPRRGNVKRHVALADAQYKNRTVGLFINNIMQRGKKSIATRLVYDAFKIIEDKTKKNPLEVFESALRNAGPSMEVKPRRVGGATLQVPVEVSSDRRASLAMRWVISYARARSGRTFSEKLAAEILDAASNQGSAIKKKEEVHKQAEANRAFAHYRW